jgi:thiol-disulfide isomerase/thioredoxin
MKTSVPFVLVLLATAALASSQGKAPSWLVSGVIVDEKGAPMPEAEIMRYFMFMNGKYVTGVEGLKADSQGRFAGKITPYKLPMTYIALNKERTLGASVVLTEESVKSPVRVVLKPFGEVNFRAKIEGGYVPVNMNTSIACDTGTTILLSYDKGPYKVPEGSYQLKFGSLELRTCLVPFTVKSGQSVDVGDCPIELTPATRAIGKPALPLDFVAARGVPQDFKLSDLKGKWVLLEFWGYWCGPCVGSSIPKLIEFHRQHPELRDKYQVIALHEGKSLSTFMELDLRNARTEANIWKGKLPFPIVIDRGRTTVERYGILGYPTVFLIDPEGKIVKGGSLELLKEKLGVKG